MSVVTDISYATFFSVLVEYVLVDFFSGTDGGSRWNWPSTSGASHNPFSLPTHSQEMDRRLKDNHRASPGSYTWYVGKIPYFFFHENSVSKWIFYCDFFAVSLSVEKKDCQADGKQKT